VIIARCKIIHKTSGNKDFRQVIEISLKTYKENAENPWRRVRLRRTHLCNSCGM